MQLVMTLLYVDVSLPSNAQQVFSALEQIVNLNLIDTSFLDENVLGINDADADPFNEIFD